MYFIAINVRILDKLVLMEINVHVHVGNVLFKCLQNWKRNIEVSTDLANWYYLDTESMLVLVRVVVCVMGDELLGGLASGGREGCQQN